MSTTVKYFHSAMTGAPLLAGQVGSLIALLDACLVTGFGTGVVDSVVISAGVATVTRSAGHPMQVGTVSLLAGATVTGGSINGEHAVLSASLTSYTFDATGIPDQTATGTITHKAAPAGWSKPFTATNVAAFKMGGVSSSNMLLRVDDTNAQSARVVGYETMTADVDGGVGPFPSPAQVFGGLYWTKSSAADASARAWVLVADERTFYLSVQYAAGFPGYTTLTFGDLVPFKSGDAYACVVTGATGSQTSTRGGLPQSGEIGYIDSASPALEWAARASTGLGSAVQGRRTAAVPFGANSGVYSGASGSFLAYPNPADNGLYVSPLLFGEASPQISLRGKHAGAYFAPQNLGVTTFSARDPVTGVTGLTGRTLRALQSDAGVMYVDCTGPWR
jgi:hypothetical protein